MQVIISRLKELLESGKVQRVLGWKKGDFAFNPEPAYFNSVEELDEFVYDGFCGANLSKYMIKGSNLEGVTAILLKPCDTYSFNQLLTEHRFDREKVYAVGIPCNGMADIDKINETLPTYKQMLRVIVTDQEIIKTTTGKVKRYEETKKM